MSLPGINYNCKPYVDVGDPLPAIGQTVARMNTGSVHVQGKVLDVDPAGRRVLLRLDGADPGEGWCRWQDWQAV